MRRIVVKRKYHISGLWNLSGRFSADAYGYVYAYKHWWQRRLHFEVKIYVPYIDDPYYDGEYATNRYLSTISVKIRAEMELKKDKVERRYRRYIKLRMRNY